RAADLRVFQKRSAESFQVNYTDRRNEDAAQGMYRRDSSDCCGRRHESEWNVLPAALAPEMPERTRFFPQSGADTSVRNGDQHSRVEGLDASPVYILEDFLTAFECEFGFECSVTFVKPRMNDPAIPSGSLHTRAVVLLDDSDRQTALGYLAGN